MRSSARVLPVPPSLSRVAHRVLAGQPTDPQNTGERQSPKEAPQRDARTWPLSVPRRTPDRPQRHAAQYAPGRTGRIAGRPDGGGVTLMGMDFDTALSLPFSPSLSSSQQPLPAFLFERVLTSNVEMARHARHLAVGQLAAWGWDPDAELVHSAALVVAELAANAVTHAHVEEGTFRLGSPCSPRREAS